MRYLIPSLLACVFLVVARVSAQGQVPAYIPVQGYLTDDDGVPIDGPVDVVLRLYTQSQDTGDAASAPFHTESQTVEVAAGTFFTYLGDKQPLDVAAFKNKANGIVFLGVAIGTGAELTPRLQLGLAPFAAFAQTCGDSQTLGGRPPEDYALRSASQSGEAEGTGGTSIFDEPPRTFVLKSEDVVADGAGPRHIDMDLPPFKFCTLSAMLLGGIQGEPDSTGGKWCTVAWDTDRAVWTLTASGRYNEAISCHAMCWGPK